MFKFYFRFVVMMISLLMVVGCGHFAEDSSEIDTDQIYLTVELEGESGSDEVKATANFRERHLTGNAIKLSDDERITVAYMGTEKTLQKKSDLLEIDYEAYFVINDESSEFVVTFYRQDDEVYSYSISMPEDFTVSSPVAGATYDEDDGLEVIWTPGEDDEAFLIDGHIACFTAERDLSLDNDNEHESWSAVDDGEYTLDLGRLGDALRREVFLEGERLLPTPCEFDLYMFRENVVSLPEFTSDSEIRAVRSSKVDDMEFNINIL